MNENWTPEQELRLRAQQVWAALDLWGQAVRTDQPRDVIAARKAEFDARVDAALDAALVVVTMKGPIQ